MTKLPPDYELRQGSILDRALLVKFLDRTYRELAHSETVSHLAGTVEQYFSRETPVWWVDWLNPIRGVFQAAGIPSALGARSPIACLWMGTAIDQLQGDRHAHIFLLYVDPAHRRQGIGSALMGQAESWARSRGDRQIGLQVFLSNQVALNLYQQLGYQPHSLGMVKLLPDRP